MDNNFASANAHSLVKNVFLMRYVLINILQRYKHINIVFQKETYFYAFFIE